MLLQYYLFLRLGFNGYAAVQQGTQDVAVYLSEQIGQMGPFDLWNDGTDIPVFAWSLRPGYTENWNLYHLSSRLRIRGWLVPAYPMPDNLTEITVQRVVVRNGLSRDLAGRFIEDLRAEVDYLDDLAGPMPPERVHPSFNH